MSKKNSYVTDTHPLIWFVTKNTSLSSTAKNIFLDHNNYIYVPIIVLVETNYLYIKGRINCSASDLKRDIQNIPNWQIEEFTVNLLNHLSDDLNIHDAMICATAINKNCSVITKDSQIQQHQIINTVW